MSPCREGFRGLMGGGCGQFQSSDFSFYVSILQVFGLRCFTTRCTNFCVWVSGISFKLPIFRLFYGMQSMWFTEIEISNDAQRVNEK